MTTPPAQAYETIHSFENNISEKTINRLEKIRARFASNLIGLSANEIVLEIKKQLRIVASLLKFDRCAISTISNGELKLLILFNGATITSGPQNDLMHFTQMPWYVEKLRRDESIALERLPKNLPKCTEKERQRCANSGIKSNIGLSLKSNGVFVGTLTFDVLHSYQYFPRPLIKQLQRIGNLFAKTLLLKSEYIKFHELFQFEKILSEISSMFANLPAEEVDKHIGYGLERIGRFLNADRCNHSQYYRAKETAAKLYSWVNEGIEPLPEPLDTDKMFPWTISRLLRGKTIHFSHLEEVPKSATMDLESWRKIGTKSHVNVPISIGGPIVGALSVTAVTEHRAWPKEIVQRLRLVGEVFSNALVRKKKELEVMHAFTQIKKLKIQLEADFTYLQEEIEFKYDHHNMIGNSEPFKSMMFKINQIASTSTNVIILGETGTGKEMVARAIHASSQRKHRPMVKVSCAALSPTLIESELFGHERGAFTGSQGRRIGRFELANGNTLFLDEIGELPIESQAKLLRVLQEGEFERLGSSSTIKVDVRIIAATNRNLEEEVKSGRFRQDLWYRLNIFPIEIPPLRQRKSDIPLLIDGFTRKFSKKLGKPIKKIPVNILKSLQNYRWPGNVRELENVVERAVINSPGPTLQLREPLCANENPVAQGGHNQTLQEIEKDHILKILDQTQWRIEGPKGAALILGLHPSTLRARMRKLKILKPKRLE